jgi:hypothetical protein
MAEIEHHWHNPTQGQVHKALYQYLTDQGINKETLDAIITKKIDAAVTDCVALAIKNGRFDQLVIEATARHIQSERSAYKNYGFAKHLQNLIERQLAVMLTGNYEVTVKERPKAQSPT